MRGMGARSMLGCGERAKCGRGYFRGGGVIVIVTRDLLSVRASVNGAVDGVNGAVM